MNKKALKISLIVLSCLIAAVLLILCGFTIYARAPFTDYYKNAEKAFAFPGLSSGFIPQGLAYDEERDIFYVSGYDSGDDPSSVFAVKNNEVKQILLQTESGEKFTGHSGGITYHDDYMYLAGSSKGCLYVINYQDVLSAKNGDFVRICGKISTFIGENDKIRVSFTGGTDTHVYVGEYYKGESYETPETHHFISGNESFGALILEYAYDETAPFGVNPKPTRAFSVTDKVQGMCFDGQGDMYLSTSAGYSYSHILQYDQNAFTALPSITIDGKSIPHYAVTTSALKKDRLTPPMSEEIVIVDGKLYAACEFAASRFFFGAFTGARHCYALDLSKY